MLILLAAVGLLDFHADAAPKWARYVTAATVCGLAAADLGTTAYAVSHGAKEANPLFSDGGRVRWGRAISFNAGACAGAVITAKKAPPRAVWLVHAPLIGAKAVTVGNNVRVILR